MTSVTHASSTPTIVAATLEPMGERCVHVCIDMQRLFAEPGDWHTPALADIVPAVERLTAHAPTRTVFTRFVPPWTPEEASGRWVRYYQRWPEVVLTRTPPAMINLIATLAAYAPPAVVVDKCTYSAFNDGAFAREIARREADTLVFSGVETDVCVLGTALDAIDRGYRVVIAEDAVASSVPPSHAAAMERIYRRFDAQVDIAPVDAIIANWPAIKGPIR